MCCGNSRRTAYHGGMYGTGNQCARPRGGLVMALIEGVQQMRLEAQQQALAAQQQVLAASSSAPARYSYPYSGVPQAAGFGTQTRGVVYPIVNGDEKKSTPQDESIDYEELPTYEEAASPSVASANVIHTAHTKSAEAPYVSTLPQKITQSLNPTTLNEFESALAIYRQSECGGRCRAKRAAKGLLKELAEQEAARLEKSHRSITRAQRKQIRENLVPVKSILKAAIREAGRE